MPSLEEGPEDVISVAPTGASAEVTYAVKNTFIEWPAARHDSLEEFLQDRGTVSCPASRAVSLEEAPEAFFHPSAVDFEHYTDSVPIEWPATRGHSLEDDCPAVWNSSIQEVFKGLQIQSDASTAASSDGDTAPATPRLSDDECEPPVEAPLVISLTDGLGIWSVGSAGHEFGTCKPCAFLWKDANGCSNGQNCLYCHLYPAGEVKRRKKEKLAFRKAMRNFHQQERVAHGMC